MGRLLRLLLDAMARGLRAVAGRLAPTPPPAVVAEEPTAADRADGPPGHWLAMVRTRAPGLHLSLQERGVVARRVAPMARALPPEPPPSALEPRRAAQAQPAAASPAASPSRPPMARPVPVSAPPSDDAQPDPEPHAWDSRASEDEQEWTRAPTRRLPAIGSPAAPRSLLSPADAAVSQVWNPSSAASAVEPQPTRPSSTDLRRAATRPDLRPVPSELARETDRHSAATPVFAPSRDEDTGVRRATPPRRSYPTPSPTPWRVEALQSPPDEIIQASPFPLLPDEAPHASGTVLSKSVSPARPPLPSPRPPSGPQRASPRHEPDLSGSWPTLPRERIPALRPSSLDEPSPSRWPELMDDASEERDDEGLALPDGHRERLAREQRGLSWNG